MAKPRPHTRQVLATKLRALMDETKMTQRDLAAASGVSQRQISNILRGENSCSIEMADQLAKPFEMTGWQLIAPTMPAGHKFAGALNRLVSVYIEAPEAVRRYIDSIIDREAGGSR